jgi:hypothetical protein
MKYIGLAYFTPEKFAALAPEDVKELVNQCPAKDEKMRATGKVLVSASLGDLDSWRTLRPSNGKTQVTDGPYTEAKEVVGGLFIIEADSTSPTGVVRVTLALAFGRMQVVPHLSKHDIQMPTLLRRLAKFV